MLDNVNNGKRSFDSNTDFMILLPVRDMGLTALLLLLPLRQGLLEALLGD
jgi:hypothetical protein